MGKYDRSILLYQFKCALTEIAKFGCVLGLSGSACYIFCHAGQGASGFVGIYAAVIAGVVISATLMGIAGYLFWFWYGGIFCSRFANSLYYTRRFLKEAPPILSAAQGMIAAGRCDEAEATLLELAEQYPNQPLPVKLLAELYADARHEPERARAVLWNYFRQKGRVESEENTRLLFMLVDFSGNGGDAAAVTELLEAEARLGCYSGRDKELIRKRLEYWNQLHQGAPVHGND